MRIASRIVYYGGSEITWFSKLYFQIPSSRGNLIKVIAGTWPIGVATFRQEGLKKNGEAMIRLPVLLS
jgi:hypothetical protein